MKIALNRCFGGFSLSASACEILGKSNRYYDSTCVASRRCEPELIAYLEAHPEEMNDTFGRKRLSIAIIPDDATDFELSDYDGMESVIYVQNGKLHHAS